MPLKRKREKLGAAKVPVLLHACVRTRDLARAVEKGHLRASKDAPFRLYASRSRASKGAPDEHVLLHVSARDAVRAGAKFWRGPRGGVRARKIPLSFVSCARLPKAVKNVERVDAAGGVVVTAADRPRVLLLRKGAGKSGRWVLPKGKRRRTEKRRAGARREVLEETGLGRVDVGSFLMRETYFDKDGGAVVFKEVSYYLMRCPKGKTRLDVRKSEGFLRGSWVSFDAAFEMTSAVRAHRTLRKARALLKS